MLSDRMQTCSSLRIEYLLIKMSKSKRKACTIQINQSNRRCLVTASTDVFVPAIQPHPKKCMKSVKLRANFHYEQCKSTENESDRRTKSVSSMVSFSNKNNYSPLRNEQNNQLYLARSQELSSIQPPPAQTTYKQFEQFSGHSCD